MEEAMLRHYPAILHDSEYLQRRPIGLSYEKAIWAPIFKKIRTDEPDTLERIKDSIFKDLQPFTQPDGIHFSKTVFYVRGVK
jgi:hypothetical protein